MKRAFVSLSCVAFLAGLAFGQSVETKPAFDIADVHISPPTRNAFLRGPVIRKGRYEIRHATMVDLVKTAYNVDAERVVGGPIWLENDTFDVIAKTPEGATVETARSEVWISNWTRITGSVVSPYGVKARTADFDSVKATLETGC